MATESTAQIDPNTSGYQVIRRNGQVTAFDSNKIAVAITKAFLAVEGDSAQDSRRIHEIANSITKEITENLTRRLDDGGTVQI